jgi:hypothetical protein
VLAKSTGETCRSLPGNSQAAKLADDVGAGGGRHPRAHASLWGTVDVSSRVLSRRCFLESQPLCAWMSELPRSIARTSIAAVRNSAHT